MRAMRLRYGVQYRQNDLWCESHRKARSELDEARKPLDTCRKHPTRKAATQRTRKRKRAETKRDEAQFHVKACFRTRPIPAWTS